MEISASSSTFRANDSERRAAIFDQHPQATTVNVGGAEHPFAGSKIKKSIDTDSDLITPPKRRIVTRN